MLNLDSASVAYNGKSALTDINLHIIAGQKMALVGHSGSGKSTLLNLLYEQLTLKYIKPALIPQDYGLVLNLSVFHNVYMGKLGEKPFWYNLINLIKPLTEPVVKVTDIINSLQLNDKLFEPVTQLSGGQKQRVAIARSIMHDGDILLADEPVSSLDESQSKLVMKLLNEQFNSIIYSLHDVDLALEFCDRIIGLDHGKIVIDAPASSLNRQKLLKLYDE